ncbi:FCSD flavin-binding domain-containing protein [Ancylobacter dichloromethanicus]
MPKSASAAVSQSVAVAAGLRARLLGVPPAATAYASRCWSLLSPGDSVTAEGGYAVVDGAMSEVESAVSALSEPPARRRQNAREAELWFQATMARLVGPAGGP